MKEVLHFEALATEVDQELEGIKAIVSDTDPTRRTDAIMKLAMDYRLRGRRNLRDLLFQLGADEMLDPNPEVSGKRAKVRSQILDVLAHEESSRAHSEIVPSAHRFGIIDMNALPLETKEWGASQRTNRTRELGWDFDAENIILNDGKEYVQEPNTQSRVLFLVEGSAELFIDGRSISMTPNSQAAIPAGTDFSIRGSGKLFALHMDPEQMKGFDDPNLVVGNFMEIPAKQTTPFHGEVAECPCGPSRRMQLFGKKENGEGWPFSTHLTTMGLHVDEVIHPLEKGHQHFRTLEAYYIASSEGSPIMTINGMSFPLKQGQLILVPRWVMHDIEGGKVNVRILVIGGHDNEDFRLRNGEHVLDRKPVA